jgi:YggT family protein
MLYQIFSFLLEVITGLLGGACLLRLYMQYHRAPLGNPLGRFVFAITDWIVLPLRRVVPAAGRWDLASGVAAWLLMLLKFILHWALMGAPLRYLPGGFAASLIELLQLAVSGLTVLLIVYAILSWAPGAAPMFQSLVARLAEPLVRPVRRVIAPVGGIDLSVLVAIVLLQVGAIILRNVMGWAFSLGL